jgi:hypothetical protein
MEHDELKQEDLTNPQYRTWMYCRIDGEMKNQIFNGSEAQAMYNLGWRLSPVSFVEPVEMASEPMFVEQADDLAYVMNLVLNIDVLESRDQMLHLANDFFKLDVKKTCDIDWMRKRVKKAARLAGMLESSIQVDSSKEIESSIQVDSSKEIESSIQVESSKEVDSSKEIENSIPTKQEI